MSILNDMGLMYEPKKENRFIISLPEKLTFSKWVAYATERPKYKLTGSDYSWQPIQIKFRDPIGPSTTKVLWDNFVEKKQDFDYTLEMIDPVGSVIERWEISGCKVLSIDFGDLSYASELNASCTLTVQPSKVQLLFS